MKRIKEYIVSFFNGLCMALADSVPGVSGGTIAFILGFYDEFIKSLDDLFRGDKKKKIEALKFLGKIGIGWIFGFVLAILFLANLFETHIYEMSSLFIGFIVFALPIVIKEEKSALKGKYYNLFFAVLGAVFVAVISYLNGSTSVSVNLNVLNLSTIIYTFLAGALAISAMILPGISGSTIMLIFGIYLPIIAKIKDFLHFDFSTVPILTTLGLGIIFGIVVFTGFLRKLLEKRRSATVYAIIGMMLGSIYSIIAGPTTLTPALSMLSAETFNILFFILGGVIIFSVEGIKKFIEKNNK